MARIPCRSSRPLQVEEAALAPSDTPRIGAHNRAHLHAYPATKSARKVLVAACRVHNAPDPRAYLPVTEVAQSEEGRQPSAPCGVPVREVALVTHR